MWSLLLVTIVNFSFFLFVLIFLKIPNHWSWGVLFTAGLKGFLVELYHAWFLACVFEPVFFSSKINNLLRYWFSDGSNMLNHIIIPRNQPNVTCFSYIFCWIRLLLNYCLVILYWTPRPYTRYYCCCIFINLDRGSFNPYKLRLWCYVIFLKWPGLDRDILKAYHQWRS